MSYSSGGQLIVSTWPHPGTGRPRLSGRRRNYIVLSRSILEVRPFQSSSTSRSKVVLRNTVLESKRIPCRQSEKKQQDWVFHEACCYEASHVACTLHEGNNNPANVGHVQLAKKRTAQLFTKSIFVSWNLLSCIALSYSATSTHRPAASRRKVVLRNTVCRS